MHVNDWKAIAAWSVLTWCPAAAMAQQWVVNCGSSLCLDATQLESGGKVQVSACSAAAPELKGQQWDADATQQGTIRNRWNGMNLAVARSAGNPAGDTVQTLDRNPEPQAQSWVFTQDQNGSPIWNRDTGQCLDAGGEAAATAVPGACNRSPSQRWKWVNVGDTRPGCAPVTLSLPAERWKQHVKEDLLPFWTKESAWKSDPFPTYRCDDGSAYGEPGCDFAALKKVNADARADDHKEGPLEWLSGPQNELFNRYYLRMQSRQTYAYGVAYQLTGNEAYLQLAHRGARWLMKNAVDTVHGGSYTFIENGKPDPDYRYRTSQDQSYVLMGLAFYYYLTRDPEALEVMTRLKNDILQIYRSPDWEGGRLLKWMLATRQEAAPTCLPSIPAPDKGSSEQKELVALLDQVNAYMLLTTQVVPSAQRASWLSDLHGLAQVIRDRFYNDGTKSKHQAYTGISPIVPPGMFAGCLTYRGPVLPGTTPFCTDGKNPPPPDPENCDPSNHHTDFGHSIKSFWMLYLIGREADDQKMMQFGHLGAKNLFPRAFFAQDGSWARAFQLRDNGRPIPFDPATATQDTNKEWWIYAELDQMAATLALIEPYTIQYLDRTYDYWLKNFPTAGGEVAQWVYDGPCKPEKSGDCVNLLIPKANLWKNGFHSLEHALVAYITTAEIDGTPATLYFAPVVTEQAPKLQPYYYRAEQSSTTEQGTIEHDGVTYRKVLATFSGIH